MQNGLLFSPVGSLNYNNLCCGLIPSDFFLNEQKHNLLDLDESSILTLVMVGSRLTFLTFYINSMGCNGNEAL